MEASVTDSEAGELSGVSILIAAALNRCGNNSVSQELLVEESGVATQISNQVANLSSDSWVLMHDQSFEVDIDIGLVDRLVEVF